jgi:hypothetical protein
MMMLRASFNIVFAFALAGALLAGCATTDSTMQTIGASSSDRTSSSDGSSSDAVAKSADDSAGRSGTGNDGDSADVTVSATPGIRIWPEDGWQPAGTLATIPITADCSATGGRLSLIKRAAGYPFAEILYCPEVALEMEREFPGSTHYLFMCETGHYHTQSDDLRKVDAWGTAELLKTPNGRHYLEQTIRWMAEHADLEAPPYGTMADRAEHLRSLLGG